MTLRRLAVALALLAVAGCAGAPGSDEPSVTTTGSDGGVVSTTTVPPIEQGPPLLPDLPPIIQVTAAAGGGPRPLLEWEPVDGAVRYDVTLFTGEGIGYWAWRGFETSVVVGEVSSLDAPGPRVEAGMSWAVLAINEDGVPIAASSLSPISP